MAVAATTDRSDESQSAVVEVSRSTAFAPAICTSTIPCSGPLPAIKAVGVTGGLGNRLAYWLTLTTLALAQNRTLWSFWWPINEGTVDGPGTSHGGYSLTTLQRIVTWPSALRLVENERAYAAVLQQEYASGENDSWRQPRMCQQVDGVRIAGQYAKEAEAWRSRLLAADRKGAAAKPAASDLLSVSYTHLALPTICSV
eukprot:2440520-Prymnesium_polylepis.1